MVEVIVIVVIGFARAHIHQQNLNGLMVISPQYDDDHMRHHCHQPVLYSVNALL